MTNISPFCIVYVNLLRVVIRGTVINRPRSSVINCRYDSDTTTV